MTGPVCRGTVEKSAPKKHAETAVLRNCTTGRPGMGPEYGLERESALILANPNFGF